VEDNEVKRPIRRNAEIRVKVDPEMEMALADIAKARGLPPATLAAVVIGEYVEKYQSNARLQREAMAVMFNSQALSDAMEKSMQAGLMQSLMNPEFVRMIQEMEEGKGDVKQ